MGERRSSRKEPIEDATVRTLTLHGRRVDNSHESAVTLDELRTFVAALMNAGAADDTAVVVRFGDLRVQLPWQP
jgi:hypothetical protein